MKNKIKFPYGVSNAEVVTTEGYTFIDKTHFVGLLENNEHFASFLPHRRIGQNFFISILEYYYDLRQKHKFEKIFGKTYIGQNPRPLASSFRVYVPTERETSTGGYVDLEIYIHSNNPNKHAQYIFKIKYI